VIITYSCSVIARHTGKELANYEIEIDSKYQYEDHARLDAAARFRKEAPDVHENNWFINSVRSRK